MKNKRVGRFWIKREIIDNRLGEIIQMFHDLKILIVRAEAMYANDSIEYYWICPEFEETEYGFVIPDYSHRSKNKSRNARKV